MKKVMMLLISMFLLVSCGIESNTSYSENYINIFNSNSDIASEFKLKDTVNLNDVTDKFYNEAAVIYESGLIERLPINNNEIIISKKNNVKGIYLFNEFHSVIDAFYDTKKILGEEKRVITVLLDGFSLGQYIYAKDNGYVDFLSNHFKNEALSVFTPVTNSGYAAIITGENPNINGIHDRSYREMKVESIFKHAINYNFKSILLEGDIKILNTEIEPVLHIDENKDGDTDDEMFESAINSCDDYDYIFLHFHGIDDRGHSFGPYANETMEYIKKTDQYIKELHDAWGGKIILTADHGMHETLEGGSHGECRASDMVVPYFIVE